MIYSLIVKKFVSIFCLIKILSDVTDFTMVNSPIPIIIVKMLDKKKIKTINTSISSVFEIGLNRHSSLRILKTDLYNFKHSFSLFWGKGIFRNISAIYQESTALQKLKNCTFTFQTLKNK